MLRVKCITPIVLDEHTPCNDSKGRSMISGAGRISSGESVTCKGV
jgi:hypothetical protein